MEPLKVAVEERPDSSVAHPSGLYGVAVSAGETCDEALADAILTPPPTPIEPGSHSHRGTRMATGPSSRQKSVQSRLPIPEAAVARLCRQYRLREIALFGSVLRDDFGPGGDVDVLVEFAPGAARSSTWPV